MGSTSPLGLSAEEVEARRRDGRGNDEDEVTTRPLALILRTNVFTRFNAILGVLLVVIAVVGPFQDALFGVILVLNTVIGVAQELRAKRTLDRLAVLSAPLAAVRRDGELAQVPLRDLVVDDAVELHRGDQVPLDGVVLDGNLELDESLLTGESDPVARQPGEDIRSGSFVSAGNGVYRVTHVGADSYARRLSEEARRFAVARSELTTGVNRFLQLVQWALFPAAALLIVSQMVSDVGLEDAIRGCVAGLGAMIPEGLVLLTSVAFAIGALRLARRRVLVQELPAVEGLARVDVLCIDKTGTLTRGGIDVVGLDDLRTDRTERIDLVLGALAAADPNPNATLAAIGGRWSPPADWAVVDVTPFSSARRWSGADLGPHGRWVLGAPEVLAPDDPDLRQRVAAETAAGHRVVLLAHESRPVALVRLAEQIRPDAAEIVRFFGREGVAVKVVSGDHPATVGAIAAQVGVAGADEPVDASALTDDELAKAIGERSVFGRVSPQQKRVIVGALQAAGHTVAMTGDGVNDVLALKDADIGVAMGSGSAATRGVAQLVLLDDAFDVLPEVIGEGRRVIGNVERVSNLFITKTVYATLIALVVGVTGVAYPLLPRHLTVVDYFSIGVPGFVLALLPNSKRFRPGFVGRVLRFAGPCGIVAGATALVAYFLSRRAHLVLAQQRTSATLVLVVAGLWVVALLARPFTPEKAALVVGLAAGFVGMLLIPALRRWFALQLPPAAQMAETLVAAGVGGVLLELVYRRARPSIDPT